MIPDLPFIVRGNLKDVTNLWEKEFLERFRKERSAQHPLRRAPNSCMRHRVEKELIWAELLYRQKCIFLLNVAQSSSVVQTLTESTEQSVPDRSKWTRQLGWDKKRYKFWKQKRRKGRHIKLEIVVYKWSRVFFFFGFVSRWVVLSDRGILPREDPGVLAQVQVQERVGVLIAGAQSLRERHHSWERERWIKGKKREMDVEEGGLYNTKRQRTLSKHFVSLHYSYTSAAADISRCNGKRCVVSACYNVIFKFSTGYKVRWDSNRRYAACGAAVGSVTISQYGAGTKIWNKALEEGELSWALGGFIFLNL